MHVDVFASHASALVPHVGDSSSTCSAASCMIRSSSSASFSTAKSSGSHAPASTTTPTHARPFPAGRFTPCAAKSSTTASSSSLKAFKSTSISSTTDEMAARITRSSPLFGAEYVTDTYTSAYAIFFIGTTGVLRPPFVALTTSIGFFTTR